MTITTREEAVAAMRQCETLERQMRSMRPSPALDLVDDKYGALLEAIEAFFTTREQRDRLYNMPGDAETICDIALRWGIDPEFVNFMYAL